MFGKKRVKETWERKKSKGKDFPKTLAVKEKEDEVGEEEKRMTRKTEERNEKEEKKDEKD